MHHSFIVTKWGWTQWIFFFFMVAGTRSLVTVHQPPVLTTALGHDVMMPCQLNLSPDERMVTPPVLYWLYVTQDNTNNPRLWVPTEKYEGRVELLDKNRTTSDKSIVLKNVQWADSGRYLCKLSITTHKDKSFRRKGNETSLKVYDTMIFNLTTHNDSLLWCEVNVTPDPGFVLSIFHNGCTLQPPEHAPRDAGAGLPYVTLSKNIRLRSEGVYECQLQLNGELITKRIFHYQPEVTEVGGDADKNGSLTCSTAVFEPSVVVFPEPWILYIALLLVPIIILLSIVTTMLMHRC
ncbi:uncharacterized protein LOC129110079 [Anoplopoma fimbria]|uniref:uncharacterized protein LOC129110079 n=1 Tax=Anoplopoma fimbria TaxID=229290 RepID=UPI0023EAAA03|nr:uncharacterized protein LOC129110079 [Anoplopoma fimbria]XP_054478205.1 uncharacterized protein LOC129110079 [Anoplopoma fimbria]